MPSIPNPNSQLLHLAHSRYNVDAGSSWANGAAGSVNPLEQWIMTNRKAARNANFWGPWMRAGMSSPISYVRRPLGDKGAKVNFRLEGQLGGPGKKGGQLFAATSDFATIPYADMYITLDLASQATSVNPHAEEMVGISIQEGVPDQLGAWGGQYMGRHIDMTMMHKSRSTSRTVINGKTRDTLVSADKIGWSAIEQNSFWLSRRGGKPFVTGKTGEGALLHNLGWCLTDMHALALQGDPRYLDAVTNSGVRGAHNPLFSGEIASVAGNTIFPRRVVIPQGQLSAGTAWEPYAHLGVADPFDAAGSAVTYKGGGLLYNSAVTNTPWFETFPGALFQWDEANSLTLASSFWGVGVGGGSDEYYALVVNPPDAATDPGKVGMIKYKVTSTAHNTITVTAKLSDGVTTGHATGINVDSIGDSVTAAGLFAGIHTQNFAVNAMIIPCNAKGTPIGAVVGYGQNAIGFIKGNRDGELFTDKVQGGLSGQQSFTGWTFGEEPFRNNSGDTPGLVVIMCAVDYPMLNLPTVT